MILVNSCCRTSASVTALKEAMKLVLLLFASAGQTQCHADGF